MRLLERDAERQAADNSDAGEVVDRIILAGEAQDGAGDPL
jgi:hypothetical protein